MIPPNKPLQRIDRPDQFYQTSKQQHDAALEDVLHRHATGQPILIVTNTIEDTEDISQELVQNKISHNVLNANNAYWEVQIIKEAGQKNAVTVSTGMAGRGTDIRLGEGVKELGGLAIIGIGRMDNIRLERQIRGRAGRQGDPGISQFYVSLEDSIVVQFLGEDKLETLLDKNHISKRRLKRTINNAQKLNEENGFSSRENSVNYDKVMKYQRNIFYEARNKLLDGGSLEVDLLHDIAKENIQRFIKETKKLTKQELNRYILDNLNYHLEKDIFHKSKLKTQKDLIQYTDTLIEERIEAFENEEQTNEFIRLCALQAMDEAWVEEVDYLQQLQYVVGGRQTAQRNPVFEYQAEAYDAFQQMQINIKKSFMRYFLLSEAEMNEEGKMSILFP